MVAMHSERGTYEAGSITVQDYDIILYVLAYTLHGKLVDGAVFTR